MTDRTRNESAYHHGDLPNALRAAGAELIAERGAAGFSLREVARRAGVSHAAPAHHFCDSQGLLTSIAVDAFKHLYEATSAAVATVDDPRDRLARCGRAYVELGRRHPGHCAVMFRHDLVDAEDPDYGEWGDKSYAVLEGVLVDLAERHNPDLDVDVAARLCWSAMQGLLTLYPNMVRPAEDRDQAPVGAIGDMAEEFAALLIAGLGGQDRRDESRLGDG